MKKRIVISLLCGLVICCIAVYSFGTTGIVNTDTLRLRKTNSTESSILTLLSIDDKVEILSRTENGWYKVKYTDAKTQKEYEGYVSGDYIKIKEEKPIIPESKPSEENKTSEEENKAPSEEVGTKEENQGNATRVINKGEKVYVIPVINSNTTKILENDVNVENMAELNGWSYVVSSDFEGWVRTDKLREADAKNKVGYINANSVNFREKPDSSGEIIDTLSRNNQVEILEENNGWIKIEYKGTIGYIAAKYISATKVETTSRSSSRRTAKTTTKTEVTEVTETSTSATNTEVVSNATTSEIVAFAKKYLGYRYVRGGNTPSGFDCSGFTQYVYKHFGYSLSRSSSSQAGDGVAVNKSNLQIGDIICFSGSSGSKKVSHVGIYIGGGRFIHSANSRKGVITSSVDGDGYFYVTARRVIN